MTNNDLALTTIAVLMPVVAPCGWSVQAVDVVIAQAVEHQLDQFTSGGDDTGVASASGRVMSTCSLPFLIGDAGLCTAGQGSPRSRRWNPGASGAMAGL
jgi:hypothetical protein